MRSTIATFAALVALLSTPAIAGSPAEMRARSFLVRAAGSPDADVKGHVEIRSDPERGREKFKVEVEKVAPGTTVTIRVGDGARGMVDVATRSANGLGEVEVELATNDGATLPAGASAAADLSGRPVEVVDANGATLLTGTVPSFGSGQNSGGSTATENPSSSDDRRARSFLTRVPGASDDNAKGHVDIRSDRGRERLEVEAEHLSPGAIVSVEIDDGSGGTLDLGAMTADSEGHAEMEWNTGDGDRLPGGAERAEDLSGRVVTVRDASGDALLRGNVPSFGDAPTRTLRAGIETRDDSTDAQAKAGLKVRRDGSSRLKLKLKGLPGNASLELWVADGGGMKRAADFSSDREGRARLKLDTRKGDAMLLGVSSAADLAGRAWQVRTAAGDPVLDGLFPAL